MSSGSVSIEKNAVSANRKKRKKKGRKNYVVPICAGITAILIAAAGIGYFSGRMAYKDKFLNDTFINGIDVSGMTVDEAVKALKADEVPQVLKITAIDGVEFDIPTAGFDYHRNGSEEIKELYKDVDHAAWFTGYAGRTEFRYEDRADFNSEKLEKLLRDQAWGAKETQDAHIELTDEGYVVYDEIQGNKVTDMDKLVETVEAAVEGGAFEVELTAGSGVYDLPGVTSESFKEQSEALNNVFNISITYDFDYTTETLTGKELIAMLNLDDMGNYSVDRDKAMEYVEKLAEKYDTFDTPRKFHATLQGDITVEPSSDAKYGWYIWQEPTCDELVEMIEDGVSIDSVDPIYYEAADGAFVFTGVEEARTADDDIGDTYIEVDLSNQELWYYKDGKQEYDCYIVSGQTTSMARTTLEGVYKLWNKQTNYRMKDRNADGEELDVTTNYWNNVSLCGIGLHDSTWRGAFGGEIYKWNGSHGCINMPYEGSKFIYDNVELGTPVVMYY
ncbi:MAG: L,D-transpeptidase family protein [Ruminococcus sp.]|nr:L,D-transpeptidase family protein [Ruminococcus sp.]